MNKSGISEETIKYICEKYNRQFGEHFINFSLRGHKFDFNAFKTQEELDDYLADMDYFEKVTKDTK